MGIIQESEKIGSKILTYCKNYWFMILVVIPLAYWLFNYSSDKCKGLQQTINTQVNIQNAIVDDVGVPLQNKTAEFFKAQTEMQNAKTAKMLFKAFIYIAAGLICISLIITTTELIGYSFTRFKFLHYIGLFNKVGLSDDERESAHKAWLGMMVILIIDSLLWISLTIHYLSNLNI